jgi:hypothetical protein
MLLLLQVTYGSFGVVWDLGSLGLLSPSHEEAAYLWAEMASKVWGKKGLKVAGGFMYFFDFSLCGVTDGRNINTRGQPICGLRWPQRWAS